MDTIKSKITAQINLAEDCQNDDFNDATVALFDTYWHEIWVTLQAEPPMLDDPSDIVEILQVEKLNGTLAYVSCDHEELGSFWFYGENAESIIIEANTYFSTKLERADNATTASVA
tara:strand:+ start:1431 stop:1778 length:348 start_codon:yes stop_codon:yes gene_type:complete